MPLASYSSSNFVGTLVGLGSIIQKLWSKINLGLLVQCK